MAFKLCGKGKFPSAFLMAGQAAHGKRLHLGLAPPKSCGAELIAENQFEMLTASSGCRYCGNSVVHRTR